jgi:uncharacterized protein
MSPEVVRGVLALLSRQVPSLRSLTLAWFGGEPLLTSSTVLRISRHANDLCQQHNVVLTGSSVTTNAYDLDLELARQLCDCGQRQFHITLDGPEQVHNRTRRRADGEGTFARIWRNLLAIKESGLSCEVLVRLHLFERNLAEMKALMPDLVAAFGGDPRFSVYLAPIEDYGGPGASTLGILKGASMAHLARTSGFLTTPWCRVEAPLFPRVCYASQARSFAIRADGRIVKCTHALDDPRNDVGRLQQDGRILLARDKLAPWLRGFVSGSREELACPMRNLSSDQTKLGAASDAS